MKWLKIRRIAESYVNVPLDIHITTEVDQNTHLRSWVVFNNKRADVFLNALNAKDDESICESLAHEIQHVKNGDFYHNDKYNNWGEEVARLKDELMIKIME